MKMETRTKDVWVFVETNDDGTARSVGLELLSPGHMMAEKQGGELCGVVIGYHTEPAQKAVGELGADKIIVIDSPEYAHYSTDAYANAICTLIERDCPTSMLIGATNNGRDLGPRVSCRLRTGLTADCTSLDIDEETGNVAWTRPAFGGNLMATIMCPNDRPQIGTVRPGVFKQGAPCAPHAKTVVYDDIHIDPADIRTQVIELIRDMDSENVDLENAEIIVSGGRGVGGPDGFKVIRDLAAALGAEVGASRAAVDSGWISHAHQVGQTGKTVSPKLYIACGISGAIQHRAGIAGAEKVIAINKDPEAAIWSVADWGIVGNLFEVIPVLIEEISKKKSNEN